MVVGMLTFRFGGLDGVSLEAAKVAAVLRDAGHEVVWFGGWLDPAFSPGTVAPGADFATADNAALQERLFGTDAADPDSRQVVETGAAELASEIRRFIEEHSVDVLMPHNVLSLPMNVPLAVALTGVLEAGGVRAIAHHHDWWFERSAYRPNNVGEIIEHCFPYRDMAHLVINTVAQAEVAARFGVEAAYFPNVMDFETQPKSVDGSSFRAEAGLGDDDLVLLQPTRVIERKGIESTIALAAALSDPRIKVVATHVADRDLEYWGRLEALADAGGVDLRFVPTTPGDGLAAAYAAADLVCFPSLIEGFGNALLETFYYRRPVLVNRYEVYTADIGPTGVQCIEISDGEVTTDAVDAAAAWLGDAGNWADAAEANYQAGLDHFSYRVVRERLLPLLER